MRVLKGKKTKENIKTEVCRRKNQMTGGNSTLGEREAPLLLRKPSSCWDMHPEWHNRPIITEAVRHSRLSFIFTSATASPCDHGQFRLETDILSKAKSAVPDCTPEVSIDAPRCCPRPNLQVGDNPPSPKLGSRRIPWGGYSMCTLQAQSGRGDSSRGLKQPPLTFTVVHGQILLQGIPCPAHKGEKTCIPPPCLHSSPPLADIWGKIPCKVWLKARFASTQPHLGLRSGWRGKAPQR